PADPTLDDRGCRKRLAAQRPAQNRTGLTKLHAPHLHIPDCELGVHKIVHSHSPGDEVPARERRVRSASLLGAKTLNLLGLDQREILSRVPAETEVPVADDAHSAAHSDLFTLDLCSTPLRT